uniref:F-box domain-containing protein n=1 Tax=Macrostomum lignano TaxID=282301 RepID=A0A1I8H016_9PLAT
MNRLMSSMMRGIGRKRRCDEPGRRSTGVDSSSSDDDLDLDPDFSPDSEELRSPVAKLARIKRAAAAAAAKKRRKTSTAKRVSKSKASDRRLTRKSAVAADPADNNAGFRSVSLDTLPTDVLLRIVEFAASQTGMLSLAASLSQVCQRLRHFITVESPRCYSTALWRNADFSRLNRKLSTAQLHSMALPRFPALSSINLENWKTLRDKDVEAICDKYRDTLSEVSLAGSDHLSGRTLTCLSDRCRRLSRLSLRRLPHRLAHGQLFTQLLQRHSDSLVDLSIDSLEGEIVGFGLLLSGLTAKPGALSRLHRLRLANLRSSSLRDSALDVSALAASAPNLRQLELANLPLAGGLPSAALPSLSSLSIVATDFDLVDDLSSALQAEVDDTGEKSSIQGFKGLRRLAVSHCTNADEADTLAPLLLLMESGQLPLLDEADFTASSIFSLPGGGDRLAAALASLPSLNELNLTGTGVLLPAVRLIASSSGSLTKLNLTACKCLPRGFKQLLTSRQSIAAWVAKAETELD